MLTGLVTVPLCIGYLGHEQYGIWMTISSFFIILGFADFGIGFGLLNAVAEASSRDDRDLIRKNVSTAFAFLLAIGAACICLAWLCYGFLPLHRLFNVSSPDAVRASDVAVLVFGCFFAVSLPGFVVLRFQEGMQEGYVIHLFQMGGTICSLLMLLLCIRWHLGLPWLVFSFQGGMAGAVLLNFVHQFWHRAPWARPSLRLFDPVAARRLLGTGLTFFILNLLGMLGMQTDALIIAHMLGPDAVTPYSVVQKLSMLAFLYWASFQALWPAYAEAIARNDLDWVWCTLHRSIKLSLMFGIGIGGGMILFGQHLINWWMRGSFPVPPSLLTGFGMFILVNSLVASLSVVMCSGILLRQQLLLIGVTVPVCLLLKIVLCSKNGIAGPIWATAIAYGLLYVLPGFFIVRKKLSVPVAYQNLMPQ